jgi:hypothetical protein
VIRTLCTVVFLTIAAIAHADTVILHSHYDASSTNPDGFAYGGSVDIGVISDKTFSIHWVIGNATDDGLGMRNGNALAATCRLDGEPGLVTLQGRRRRRPQQILGRSR